MSLFKPRLDSWIPWTPYDSSCRIQMKSKGQLQQKIMGKVLFVNSKKVQLC